jgi:hypothetical protein
MAMPDQAANAPVLEPSRRRAWQLPLAIGAILILAAVVLISGGYVAVQGLGKQTLTDPAAIRALTDEIISIDIPASLPPVTASSARLNVRPKQVTYGATTTGRLTLTQYPEPRLSVGLFVQSDLDKAFDRVRPKAGTAITPKVVDLNRTINGKPAVFSIGTLPLGNMWMVAGKFQGRGGPTLLEMSLAAPAFSEESVRALLESVH